MGWSATSADPGEWPQRLPHTGHHPDVFLSLARRTHTLVILSNMLRLVNKTRSIWTHGKSLSLRRQRTEQGAVSSLCGLPKCISASQSSGPPPAKAGSRSCPGLGGGSGTRPALSLGPSCQSEDRRGGQVSAELSAPSQSLPALLLRPPLVCWLTWQSPQGQALWETRNEL